MKKILIIEPAGKLYGSEMVLWDILYNLGPSGKYEFTVLLPPNSPFSNELKNINVSFKEILNINGNLYNKLLSYVRVLFYVLTSSFDLVYINQAGILRSIAVVSFFKKLPIVCQVSTLEDCPWLNNLNNWYFKNVKSFICNSIFIADNLNVQSDKKSTLYYGYHWKGIKPKNRDIERPFKIVLLGRISESKGHFLTLHTIKELVSRGFVNFQLYFVGSAPNLLIDQEIRNLVSIFKLEDYVIFRGFQKNIESELSDKNVMIIPSYEEPFGRIFCEAAEAKLPVIVSNSGGLGELSTKFNVGIQFEAKNSNDFADKIQYFADNYFAEKENFLVNSESMLKSLDMNSYIDNIELILNNSINRSNISVTWLGD